MGIDLVDYIFVFFSGLSLALIERCLVLYLNRSWFNQGFVGDSSVHFTMIKQLKKNQKSRYIEQYVIPNTMSYPLGFHRFSSIFPLTLLKEHPYIPNLMIFCLSSGLYFSYLLYVETQLLGSHGYSLILISGFIYFISVGS